MLALAVILAGYAIGCVVPGYYVVRRRTGRDIRTLGSGKVGATNVKRVLGARWAATTMVADVVKGAVAVGLARLLDLDAASTAAVGCAVVAGHVWPVQLGLRGGRGAATALGAALVLAPVAAVLTVLIAAAGTRLTGRATPSGIMAIAAAPLLALAFDGRAAALAVAALAAIVLVAHRDHLPSPRRSDGRVPGSRREVAGVTVAPAVRDGGS